MHPENLPGYNAGDGTESACEAKTLRTRSGTAQHREVNQSIVARSRGDGDTQNAFRRTACGSTEVPTVTIE